MKFIAIRHGQSEYNIKGLCNDELSKQVPLTELGRQQALNAGKILQKESLRKIYCSPLLRTVQTAELINQSLNLPLSIEPDLIDIKTGFDSKPVKDYLAFIKTDPINQKLPGYESLSDYFNRIFNVLNQFNERQEENFLLVVHEETLRVCKAWSENLTLEEVIGQAYENCVPYYFS